MPISCRLFVPTIGGLRYPHQLTVCARLPEGPRGTATGTGSMADGLLITRAFHPLGRKVLCRPVAENEVAGRHVRVH